MTSCAVLLAKAGAVRFSGWCGRAKGDFSPSTTIVRQSELYVARIIYLVAFKAENHSLAVERLVLQVVSSDSSSR